jgi:hypothetical protein
VLAVPPPNCPSKLRAIAAGTARPDIRQRDLADSATSSPYRRIRGSDWRRTRTPGWDGPERCRCRRSTCIVARSSPRRGIVGSISSSPSCVAAPCASLAAGAGAGQERDQSANQWRRGHRRHALLAPIVTNDVSYGVIAYVPTLRLVSLRLRAAAMRFGVLAFNRSSSACQRGEPGSITPSSFS